MDRLEKLVSDAVDEGIREFERKNRSWDWLIILLVTLATFFLGYATAHKAIPGVEGHGLAVVPILNDLKPQTPTEAKTTEPWSSVPWFIPAMKAIAEMEFSGGRNQRPNVDGIVGIGQVERCFYQDAKEYAKTDDFPSYEDLQGYDEKAFHDTCVVAWYWFKRYKADTPYLMFARFRKGPRGEKTETGQAYADKAFKIMDEKFTQNDRN